MKVEIFFHTSSTPKVIKDVHAIYTKGGLLSIQRKNREIIAYPLINVFSINYMHKPHAGSTFQPKKKKK